MLRPVAAGRAYDRKERSMGLKNNTIKWEHVEKWYQREAIKTHWKPWGVPEIVDPKGSAFADVDPMPKWNVPEKIAISATINGAFFTRNANPNVPVTPREIIKSAEECIEAGATIIHLHVRDEKGYNVLDVDLFRRTIEPLRERHPDIAIDGCLVAVNDEESRQMEDMMTAGLLDAVPINTCAILIGDNMFFKSPHAIIKKAQLALQAGVTPQIAVYSDGDIDNARRFLIDTGLLEPPFFWLVLPALPGCSPMYSPESMISGLTRYVAMIREISTDSVISVCAAGRASTYLSTLATLMGLNIRVGMEDTIYKWPHKDELITSNAEHFRLARQIAESLGRDVMSAAEYMALIGATPASELKSRAALSA
jgi:3-keto-5-aminohexanoate cleavage enzyme